ncbi:hypothetical protein ElyMa_005310200 [Elysia marginata]|uniref:Uncharacterized protein n=1 Tax=Elysia marginata TaxID=1093978 RepID=A0AAV4K277_9GAST|nr:hypothetical protein ElyMa_005310200 [Elysia marginata]
MDLSTYEYTIVSVLHKHVLLNYCKSSQSSQDDLPALWPSGKVLAQRSGGAWFDPQPSQTKDFKLGISSYPPSVRHYGFSVKSGRPSVRIMGLGVVYAIAPYITVWRHAFNCPQRRL